MCTDFVDRPAGPYFVCHLAGIDAVGPFDSGDVVVAAFDSAMVRQQTPRHRMTGCEMSANSK